VCSESETGAVRYDKLSFTKNSDRCTLEFKVFHNAGCGVVKAPGFLQFLSSNALIFAVILIVVGFVTWIFGKMLIKYVYLGLPALIVFLFLAIFFSYVGVFSILEED
jgi:hypothetical protein